MRTSIAVVVCLSMLIELGCSGVLTRAKTVQIDPKIDPQRFQNFSVGVGFHYPLGLSAAERKKRNENYSFRNQFLLKTDYDFAIKLGLGIGAGLLMGALFRAWFKNDCPIEPGDYVRANEHQAEEYHAKGCSCSYQGDKQWSCTGIDFFRRK